MVQCSIDKNVSGRKYCAIGRKRDLALGPLLKQPPGKSPGGRDAGGLWLRGAVDAGGEAGEGDHRTTDQGGPQSDTEGAEEF